MKKVKIVGVREHFNLPWHLAIEENAFADRGIDLQWTDIPEGTGKMSKMLAAAETDLAIILTEGIVKSIHDGSTVKIVQEYIATPLLWGIHVGYKSPIEGVENLEHTKAAISRMGSGSHLMAYVYAAQMGWNTEQLNFEIINNLDGAVDALTTGTADYFLWEHFTTKPLVDQNIFRRLADVQTPWPCFVIAATEQFINADKDLLNHILEIINLYTQEFKRIPSINRTLANRYAQQLEDIDEWLRITHWSQEQLPIAMLKKVQNTLKDLELIPNILPKEEVLYIR